MFLLVDMDAFFASVEQLHHPHLRGQPLIVCGDPERRGVVTAASYEARQFGIRAGMPLVEARRLCPGAHYVEGNPEKYVALSLQLLSLYLETTPDVEPFSVDEAFLALSGKGTSLVRATEVAQDLQDSISDRFGLPATIGIGPNKLVAKMASGVRKPRGITALDVESFREVFWPRPVQELWGVGPKLSERMAALAVRSIGDLARAPEPRLREAFGIIGPQLREAAWGHDDTPLVPYHRGLEPKSMGHEVTLGADSDEVERLEGILLRLSDQVARRLRGEGYLGRTIALKLRDRRFVTRMRQTTLGQPTQDHRIIFSTARSLMRSLWNGEEVRLLGVSVSRLERTASATLDLFAQDRRQERLRRALDRVRDRLGEASLIPAGALSSLGRLSHVPFGALSARASTLSGSRRRRAEDVPTNGGHA